jgi:hypothetical protein
MAGKPQTPNPNQTETATQANQMEHVRGGQVVYLKPYTPNPKPSTLNPQPSTLNPQPSTLNPQPSTLNPQPSTLNPSTVRQSEWSMDEEGKSYTVRPIQGATLPISLRGYNLIATAETGYHRPQTPNPQPSTLTHNPQTLNHKP